MYNKQTFGQAGSQPAFGFGQTTNTTPFGQSSFGKIPGSTGFGNTAFGSAGTSMFGGQTQTAPALFPSTSSTPSFGQTTSNTSGFGAFGNVGGSNTLFGQPQPATNLFSSSTTPAFGQTKPASFSSGFGSTSATPLFGSAQPTQQSTPAPLFGQSSSGQNLFGGAATTFGGAATQTGTVIKFNPVAGTDTMVKNKLSHPISTRHHCITCMKEYEGKSLEELRFEDYLANRKGPQQGAPGTTNTLFSSQPTAQNPTLFGQTGAATGGFGQTQSMFGATQNTQNFFGQKTGGFGTATTSTSSPFSFNSAAPATPFASSVPKPFSVPPAGTNLFSSSNPPATNTFGQPAPAFGSFGTATTSTNYFQQNKPPMSSFNMPPASNAPFGSFGQAATTNVFEAPKTTPSVFPTNSFGQPQATQSSFGSFGQTQPQQSNLMFNTNTFNKPAGTNFGLSMANTSGMLGFGNQTQTAPGLFGNKPSGTGLFDSATQNQPSLFNNTFSQSLAPFGQSLMQPSLQFPPAPMPVSQIHEMIMTCARQYPEQEIFKGLTPIPESALVTNPIAIQNVIDSSLKIDDSASHKEVNRAKSPPSTSRNSLIFSGLDDDDELGVNTFTKHPRNPRRLYIKRFPNLPPPTDDDSQDTISQTPKPSEFKTKPDREMGASISVAEPASNSSLLNLFQDSKEVTTDEALVSQDVSFGVRSTDQPLTPEVPVENKSIGDESPSDEQPAKLKHRLVLDESEVDIGNGTTEKPIHPTGIKCTRVGYYTIPSLDELISLMKPDGSIIVNSFTIGRQGYGNVFFPDTFDVANIDIDKHVHFRYKEIIIYVRDDEKPPVGQGLNREAQITLDQVYPIDKVRRCYITDPEQLVKMNYEEVLRSACNRHRTHFLEYRPESGSWVFRVPHFTRYALVPEEEDELCHMIQTRQVPDSDIQTRPAPRLQPAITISEVFESMETSLACEPDEQEPSPRDQEPLDDQYLSERDRNIRTMKQTFFPRETEEDIESDSNTIRRSGEAILSISNYVDVLAEQQFKPPKKTLNLSQKEISCSEKIIGDFDLNETTPLPELAYDKYIKRPKYAPLEQGILMQLQSDAFLTDDSNILTNTKNLADLSLMKNRSFRTRFDKTGNLLVIQHIPWDFHSRGISSIFDCSNPISRVPVVKRLQFPTHVKSDSYLLSIEQHLRIQLDHCDIDTEEVDFPYAYSLQGPKALHQHAEKAQHFIADHSENFLLTYWFHVWKLFEALWGESLELEGELHDSHIVTQKRRECFANWMQKYMELLYSDEEKRDVFKNIISNNLLTACKLAREHKYPTATLLISQLGSSYYTPMFIQDLLNIWSNCNFDDNINQFVLKMYLLSAGKATYRYANNEVFNVFNGLQWLECLALYLWYYTRIEGTLTDVLFDYKSAFESAEQLAEPPYPLYQTKENLEVVGNIKVYDMIYHLLNLYSNNSYSMDQLLNPVSYTSNPLDYSLSWFVMENLKALGYNHLRSKSEIRVHIRFANQLERENLWHWAVFVLMHIQDTSLRRRYVTEIIAKNVSLNQHDDEYKRRETFCIKELKISPKIFSKFKGMRCVNSKLYNKALLYFLHCKDKFYVNKLFWEHVAPTEIINRNFKFLIFLIQRIIVYGLHDRRHLVAHFLFKDLKETIIGIDEKDESIKEHLKLFVRQMQPLSNEMLLFPKAKTREELLMVNEMCRYILMILHAALEFLNDYTEKDLIYLYTWLTTKLPLPPNLVLEEIRDIANLYVVKFMTTSNYFPADEQLTLC